MLNTTVGEGSEEATGLEVTALTSVVGMILVSIWRL